MKTLVSVAVPNAYNPGQFKIQKLVTGPRGGKSWKTVHASSATGGTVELALDQGQYKKVWWSNGWPQSKKFAII
jgi:hypothetical protein